MYIRERERACNYDIESKRERENEETGIYESSLRFTCFEGERERGKRERGKARNRVCVYVKEKERGSV